MNNNSKARIPTLRFPEFANNGEWEEQILKDITPAIFDGTHQTPTYIEKGIPFYSVENIVSGNKNKYISLEDYHIATAKNKPEKNDILITRIGNIGLSKVVTWDFEFSIYVTLAVVKKSPLFHSYFLHSYFQSDKYQKEIRSKSLLNAVPCKINMDELRRTLILMPKLQEQQKIADCLSLLDDLIMEEFKKYDSLKEHKKGLMKKLFPVKDQTVPQLRFPEFTESGEWEERLIDNIGNVITGKTPNTNEQSLWNGDVQFVTPTDMNEQKYQIRTQRTVVRKEGIYILPKNSIMYSCIASIGKISLSVYPCITNQQINSIVPYSIYDNEFIFYAMIMKTPYIKAIIANTTLPIINKTNFSKLILLIPKTAEEQQKIAQCLASLDELIAAQAKKIETLKLHKKALMQGLFPANEEANE